VVLALPHEVRATRTLGSPPDWVRPGAVGRSQPTAGEAWRVTRRLVEDDLWSAKASILPTCGSPPRISLSGGYFPVEGWAWSSWPSSSWRTEMT